MENVTFDVPTELGIRLAEMATERGLNGCDGLTRRIILDYLEDMENLAIAEKVIGAMSMAESRLVNGSIIV